MNRLPSNLVGRKVRAILNSGEMWEGTCTLAREDYLMLRNGSWEYTIEADAIAAIGVNRGDDA